MKNKKLWKTLLRHSFACGRAWAISAEGFIHSSLRVDTWDLSQDLDSFHQFERARAVRNYEGGRSNRHLRVDMWDLSPSTRFLGSLDLIESLSVGFVNEGPDLLGGSID
ncbi:unnamed protein product [Sphenostylis stenocarpa]|uniref:Uncharacterized protein n=1 Tax=Sphenostylis stenocarpa TaxID=92480 RepID=A0AA86W1P6_9FABA|nr:unnamed protein product [Sphenostylis stenocarpa]